MRNFLYIALLTFIFTNTSANLSAQFYEIELEVDSSKKAPLYKNNNPRGVDNIDSTARITGNYKRGFFPNQKVKGFNQSKNKSQQNPNTIKTTPFKEEEDEK